MEDNTLTAPETPDAENNASTAPEQPVQAKPPRQPKRRRSSYFRPSVERLRIVLMFFLCVELLGFPTRFGAIVQLLCGFVPPAFFILSGYLVLRPDGDRRARIVRAIGRSALAFAAFAAVCFVLDLFYYRSLGVNIFEAFVSRRVWFELVVLNVWPFDIGSAIWYLQALLYAYIIIYFMERWRLLRYDWLLIPALLALAVVTGELAGLLPWSWHGYTYVPGNFLTRALPYVLLGGFMHRKITFFEDFPGWIYALGILLGCGLSIAEVYLLDSHGVSGYYGHLLGTPLVAVSVCMLALADHSAEFGLELALNGNRRYTNAIYYACQPVSVLLIWRFLEDGREYLSIVTEWLGVLTFVVCFIVLCVAAFLERVIFWEKTDG